MSKSYAALPVNGSVKQHYLYNTIKINVVNILQHIPEIINLKGQTKLLELTCQMIEDRVIAGNSKKKPTEQIDKKQLVIDVMDKLFSLNTLEKSILSRNIDYIFEHKSLIKRNTFFRRLKSWVRHFFCDPNKEIMDCINTPTTPQEFTGVAPA